VYRKLFGIAVWAVVLGVGLTGTAAAARPAAPTTDVSVVSVWVTIGYYPGHAECQNRGRLLVGQGLYKAWACDWVPSVSLYRLRALD
jgi:hypothetical protein